MVTMRIPWHRGIIIAVHAMIIVTMLVLFFAAGAFERANPVFIMIYLMVPGMVIAWSLVGIERKARILGYWGLAALMVPLAGLGIFGGYGLLYLIGVFFLLWAAWVENEGKIPGR